MFIRKGKCKRTLYLLEHKFVKYKGLGYRCKYCGKSKVRENK